MPENPDVEVSSSQLPWKCVRLTCALVCKAF